VSVFEGVGIFLNVEMSLALRVSFRIQPRFAMRGMYLENLSGLESLIFGMPYCFPYFSVSFCV